VQQCSYAKGDAAWYRQRDGIYIEAQVRHARREGRRADPSSLRRPPTRAGRAPQVVAVDRAVQPPSYAVRVGGSVRETEAERLRPRSPGQAPPAGERPLCGAAGAAHGRAAGTLPAAPACPQPAALPPAPHPLWAAPAACPAPGPSGGGDDGFGDFTSGEAPAAAHAPEPDGWEGDFGGFIAAEGASPRRAAPTLGGAGRSPFDEALAFAVSAPVHAAPGPRPGGPVAHEGAPRAAPPGASPLPAVQSAPAPSERAPGTPPREESQGWAWAGGCDAAPADASRSLPAGVNRCGPRAWRACPREHPPKWRLASAAGA